MKTNTKKVASNEIASTNTNTTNTNTENTAKEEKVAKVAPSIIINTDNETEILAESAKVLKENKSISNIKTRFSEYQTIYGGNVWKMIFSRCKDIRKTEITRIGEKVSNDFRDYTNALKHEYKRLDGNKDFRTLCGFIGDKDIRNWFNGATDFVATFYSNVIDGNPCTLVSYVYKGGYILKAYKERELNATHAVPVLSVSLKNAINSARKRVQLVATGADLKDTPINNGRISGAVVSAYFLNPDGTTGEKIGTDNPVYKSLLSVDISTLETLAEYRKRVLTESENK